MFDNRFYGQVASNETVQRRKRAVRLMALTELARLPVPFTSRDANHALTDASRTRMHLYDDLRPYQVPRAEGLLREFVNEGLLRTTKDSCNSQRNLYYWVDEGDARTEEDDIVDEMFGSSAPRPAKRSPKPILDSEATVCYDGSMNTTQTKPARRKTAYDPPATDRQISFLTALDQQLRSSHVGYQYLLDDGHSDIEHLLVAHESGANLIGKAKASELIDWCLKQKESIPPAPKAEPVYKDAGLAVTEGIWLTHTNTDDPKVWKIQVAHHGSGNLYGKLLTNTGQGKSGWQFVYESGVVGLVAGHLRSGTGEKLTPEKAAAFGHLYGVCCVCGATLTDEDSIERGIGPVCAGKI